MKRENNNVTEGRFMCMYEEEVGISARFQFEEKRSLTKAFSERLKEADVFIRACIIQSIHMSGGKIRANLLSEVRYALEIKFGVPLSLTGFIC